MTPEEFEQRTGLSGYRASRLLRVSESKYYAWRRGDRVVPGYIESSMVAHAEALDRGWDPSGSAKDYGSSNASTSVTSSPSLTAAATSMQS